jgi:hypothetical protein
MYPDATFTMRVSYGKVDDYKPATLLPTITLPL